MQLRAALRESTAEGSAVLNATTAFHGYHVVDYNVIARLDASTFTFNENRCDVISATLDAILDSCKALGFNVTRDTTLHIVDDVESTRMVALMDTLPVLIMPYADNSLQAPRSVPG
uniref:Uncharacterized protein n=1 Tax=Globisporangium ultimum (strain ATCC 200006 / CBS 805.95 / DAOM BR144) TaxID=431595 RepID=K3WDX2_GLOUD